jgi:hypothetical protein
VLGGDFDILAGKPPRRNSHPGHKLFEEIRHQLWRIIKAAADAVE